MQSLPKDCAFNILCFGAKRFDWMQSNKAQQYYKYEDWSRKTAIE